MLQNETPKTNLSFYSNQMVRINSHWLLTRFAILKNYLNIWNSFLFSSMKDWETIAVEGRVAVPVWEWEFGGVMVAAPAACLCLYRTEKWRTHPWSRGVEHRTPVTQPGASQTRRLRESRKICLLDPSFPCGPGRRGGCALGDLDKGPPGSSHPYRFRRVSDGDSRLWGQNLTPSCECGDVWQVNGTHQLSKQQLPISTSGDTSFLWRHHVQVATHIHQKPLK